ncbi:MAG: phosphoribosyltransferase family protein [Alphaproteobacteria bacterium]|nr:phosphoribosyltransferase family protein [Alphaproteobacteria bacterium]
MNSQEFLDILKSTGGYITNSHIIATSGKHIDSYMNKDAIYPHTKAISAVCRAMAEPFAKDGIEAVVGPALGGIVLSQWVAHHLSEMTGKDVLAIYTEKTADKDQILTRGYDKLVAGKRILVVEDILTTGGSVIKVVNTVKKVGAEIVGVSVMINRNPAVVTSELVGAPLTALASLTLPAWDEADCPMCKQGMEINVSVGKGRDYLAQKAAQSKAS